MELLLIFVMIVCVAIAFATAFIVGIVAFIAYLFHSIIS